MAQIRLINNTGKPSILGKLVKYNPANPKGFIYAKEGDPGIIGKVARKGNNETLCLITLISKSSNNNDYTIAEKNKLAGIQAGAEVNINANWNATGGDAEILNKPSILAEEFESVSKNLISYPYVITYDGDDVDYITYDLGGRLEIIKTFHYTDGVLTSLVLSGDTPSGIDLTKTLHYTGDDLTSVTYS